MQVVKKLCLIMLFLQVAGTTVAGWRCCEELLSALFGIRQDQEQQRAVDQDSNARLFESEPDEERYRQRDFSASDDDENGMQ